MTDKIKTYVLTISDRFPVYHNKHNKLTNFRKKILTERKIHTIRSNVILWKRRIENIQNGKAVLSVRRWTGRPYNSKQEVLTELMCVGYEIFNYKNCTVNGKPVELKTIAQNDGLSRYDFISWFYPHKKDEEMIIIHFTPFRYGIKTGVRN